MSRQAAAVTARGRCGTRGAAPRARLEDVLVRVADCEGYVMVGEYEDGRPSKVFIKVSEQGSTLAGSWTPSRSR